MQDAYSRHIDYLRVSVTDRCNLRCVYCMPEEGVPLCGHKELLSYEEIVSIVSAAAELGIRKVRLTGGEPLVRLGLCDLISALSHVGGIEDLSLSTNGVLLAEFAAALKSAGLHRVNVSLDSLRPDRYRKITRVGNLYDVLKGIEAAEAAGLSPIKINMVVMRGINDDEVRAIADLAITRGWRVRFIEKMPLGGDEEYVSCAEVFEQVSSLGELIPEREHSTASGPARCYRVTGAKGKIGFISPMSEPFCASCNRLRLTSTGSLRPCLLSEEGTVDLRTALRAGASKDAIQQLIRLAVSRKPDRHHVEMRRQADGIQMSSIGG